MPYLIDSDWTIDHLAGVPAAEALLQQLADEGLAISIVTYMEVYEGIQHAASPPDALSKFEEFLTSVRVVPMDIRIARRCAELRNSLRAQNRRVNSRAMDVIVAATAIADDLTLVTRNVRDYTDIPGLKLYEL